MDPTCAVAHEDLGAAFKQQGYHDEGMKEAILALRYSGQSELSDRLQTQLSGKGYKSALASWIEALQADAKTHYISPVRFAQLYILLADRYRAFAALDAAVQDRSPQLVYLKVDPRYDLLRSDKRFTILLERIGL